MSLIELYQDKQYASFLHSQAFVEGCLLGACACPEIPLPDVWLPWVIKHHHQIKDAEQANLIADKLFVYVKSCLSDMHNASLIIPTYAVYEDQNHERLQQWCEGLLMAHSAREKFWQGAWDKMQHQAPTKAPMLAKNLKHCLKMFSTFADPKHAIKTAKTNGDDTFADKLPLISQSIQQTLETYVSISGELATYLPNQFETFKKP